MSDPSFACEHLAGCAQCQALVEQLADDPELRRRAKVSWPAETPVPGEPALARLRQRLHNSPPPDVSRSGSSAEAGEVALRFLEPADQEGDLGKLGSYRILAELGRGGMGIVLLAYDPELRRTVALKVLPPERADAKARARFVREAQAAAGIEHDHVVPVHAVANPADGPPYFVMQYVQGPTLRQRIKAEGRLDPREAARIGAQVAEGLAAAHQAGLIHRDIKPANIILDQATGRAKIMDFGLVRAVSLPGGSTQEGAIPGTPEYMSPEQVRDPERIDVRTDVYSLGVTLYEALTGEVPFRGVPQVVLQQVLNDEPRPPRRLNDQIPRDLETICLKAMAKEPGRRYGSARALADDLGRFLKGEAILARPVGGGERLWRWSRRNPVPVAAAAVVVFAVGLTTALLTVGYRSERAAKELALQREGEAKDYFKLARQAVDDYSAKVSKDPRLLENLRPLRKELLQTVVPFYERLVELRADDVELRMELGQACMQLGFIMREIGDQNKAIASYQQAVDIFAQLAREDPSASAYQTGLAHGYNDLAVVYQATGKIAEAERALVEALTLKKRLAEEHPEDATHQGDLAKSHHNMGHLYYNRAQMPEAEAAYRAALSLLQPLADAHPADTEHQSRLAQTYNNLGMVYRAMREWEKADKAYQDALTLRRRLVEKHPDVSQYQLGVAQTLNNLGNLYQDMGERQKEEKAFQESVASRKLLAERYPEVIEYQIHLAQSYYNLGIFYQRTAERAAAEQAYRKAMAISKLLRDAHPDIVEPVVILGGTYCNLGRLLADTPQATMEWFDKAIECLGSLLQKDPREKTARELLGNAYFGRADVLSAMGRHVDAIRDCDRAVELENVRKRDGRRCARAATLARLGEHGRATAEADDLMQDTPLRHDKLYNLACVYSLSAAAVAKDSKLPEAERDKLANQYAARALELLKQAQAAGFFKDLANVAHMNKDDDLAPLRPRPDYQKLLAELEAKPKPGGR